MRWTLIFLPLAGVVIGAIQCIWFMFCRCFNANMLFFAVGATLIPLCISGGIHLDLALCDTCDALCSFGNREKRLAILKVPARRCVRSDVDFGIFPCGMRLAPRRFTRNLRFFRWYSAGLRWHARWAAARLWLRRARKTADLRIFSQKTATKRWYPACYVQNSSLFPPLFHLADRPRYNGRRACRSAHRVVRHSRKAFNPNFRRDNRRFSRLLYFNFRTFMPCRCSSGRACAMTVLYHRRCVSGKTQNRRKTLSGASESV